MKIARETKKKLSEQIPVFDLRLFGSRARGDDTPESDLDIYIETVSLTRQQQQIVSDILWEIGFENGPLFASPIYRVIMKEGIPI